MANRLGNETSPYLLQHKDNPVDWYPWGEEARERARREDRPILLSVGYSACHWCHVMAHESFEDPDTAALMNDLFVNIKVDREERPDVDSIYMQAVQSMTGRGGWPMTVFLTPDGWPFYGGTYFPPVDGRGLPAFPRVLQAVADAYREKKTDVARAAGQLREQLDNNGAFAPVDSDVGADVLGDAVAGAAKEFDAVHGGFGHAPKFPPAMLLDFFLRYHHLTGDRGALDMTEFTLDKMARGGMYDQVGGGFHRYSTDAIWLVPHFEKMLYDNALLARVYLDAYRVTGKDAYRRVCQETLDYVLREMTDATGAFYSTQDADSEGVEGKFFLWTMPEFDAVLGADAGLFRHYFGLTPGGNFEGKNILYLEKPLEDFAEERDVPDFRVRLEAARAKLYAARETRVHPGRDEKVLAAWNGLMLRAFAEAGRALDSQAYREAARRNADFLLASMWLPDATAGTKSGKRLLRTWKAGEARLKGYLEDYADLIDGLLATQEATFELHYLEAAITLADEMIDLFWDEEAQGFFDTGRDHEALIARPRDVFDNATPSGSSVAADVLLRLATLTGEARFERYALPVLKTFASVVHRAPTAFGRLLAALHFHLAPVKEVALVWQRDAAPAQSMVDALFLPYRPNIVVAGAVEGEGAEVTPLLADRTALGGCAAYVCEHFVCQLPVTDAEGLEKLLAGT